MTGNLPALISKLKDGFCITYVNSRLKPVEPANGASATEKGENREKRAREFTAFIIRKKINQFDSDSYAGEQIINLSELEKIWKLLVRGWDGVEIEKDEKTVV